MCEWRSETITRHTGSERPLVDTLYIYFVSGCEGPSIAELSELGGVGNAVWPQQSEKSASLLVVHAVPTREPDKDEAGKRKK